MGVYIKGMKMPKKCIDCFFNDFGTECGLLEHDVEDAILHGTRYGGCPLLPVPDHGDLIDREALTDGLVDAEMARKGIVLRGIGIERVNNAPVIIPAERSDNEET